jgi:KipI family sensor histidine kinase inhibitor
MVPSQRVGDAASPFPRIESASDHGILVLLGKEPSRALASAVRALFGALRINPPAGLLDLHPAYASLLVDFDPLVTDHETVAAHLLPLVGRPVEDPPEPARVVEVPVCYGGPFGPDIANVARHCGLSPEEVVARHSASTYLVHFLGFSPGFPYLGGLDPTLATPRLERPRTRVEAGSVAIGGGQTGIYPVASPGGWHVIGRTPVRLFDPLRTSPALLQMGDEVHFLPVTPERFASPAGGV